MAATMETNRKSSTSFHRVIPDALKLHDSRTRVINPDIKVLLHHPSDQHKVTNDDSTVLSQSSFAEKLDRVTSNLSAKAAVFVPKSSISETNARKFHAKPKTAKRNERITFCCYGIDGVPNRYEFRIDDTGCLLAIFNALIPPPIIMPIVAQTIPLGVLHPVNKEKKKKISNVFTRAPPNHSSDELAIVACVKVRHQKSMALLRTVHQMKSFDREELRREMVKRMSFIAEMFVKQLISFEFIVKVLQDFQQINCVESIEPLCRLLELIHNHIPFDERVASIVCHLDAAQTHFPPRTRNKIKNLLNLKYQDVCTCSNRDKILYK